MEMSNSTCNGCSMITSFGIVYCIDLAFPPGFQFGAATASYQIEGGWNASDKSESIWDVLTHTYPQAIKDNTNGDVACDSYNLWKKDVEIAVQLGLDFYRFSLSWPRLFPSGYPDKISEDGVRYYNNLIDALIANGIEPVVTMFHWDLPQTLQDLGGWANSVMVDLFEEYARALFTLFGDRVKTWITFNEAISICDLGYGVGGLAPRVRSMDYGNYLCAKNLLHAHGKAYRLYCKYFKPKFHGKVGIANQLLWMEGKTEADEELAELARELTVGLYSHAIFSKEGGWPPALERKIAEYGIKQGKPWSKLPAFTKEEIECIRGSFDFCGINHYTSRTVTKLDEGKLVFWPVNGSQALGVQLGVRPEWTPTVVNWFFEYPEGFRHQLLWFKAHYGDVPILITENGYPTKGSQLEDRSRVDYYKSYMQQLLLSIKVDGVNVFGYTSWSLMDNFEWLDGYSSKFGLYEVDFNSVERTRTARLSAKYYADIIKNRSLNVTDKYV